MNHCYLNTLYHSGKEFFNVVGVIRFYWRNFSLISRFSIQ